MPIRYSLLDAQLFAKSKNGKCLSEEYKNSQTKMKWQCESGHIWEARYSNIKQNHWCPYCAGKAKHTLQDAQNLAKAKEGKCLSTAYKGANKKLIWQCKDEHVWGAKYSQIQQGHWCPKCAGVQKLTLQNARNLASHHNGKCLSGVYINSGELLTWECQCGFVWQACFDNVKANHWCPFCAGNIKNTINDAVLLAKKNNGKCLSKTYVNSKAPMIWECSCGHIWKTRYDNIQSGKWCPKCASHKTQNKLADILEDILQLKCRLNYRPKWLKNPETGYSLEIDIYFPDIKLAVEYNGEQHYRPIPFCKMAKDQLQKKFLKLQKRDQIKKQLLENSCKQVCNFIIFSYHDTIDRNSVLAKLQGPSGDIRIKKYLGVV